jgi:hypothetical protein
MVRSVVGGIARFAGMAALVLGLAGALATPAGAAGAPGPGYTVAHQPGLGQPPGLAQPAFPPGLWRPAATGPGIWRPVRTPAASLRPPAAAPAAAGSPWRVQQTPNPVIPNGVLDAVACARPGTCIAVGGYENRAGTEVPLAQARTSTSWRILAAATPRGAVFTNLFGVSCPPRMPAPPSATTPTASSTSSRWPRSGPAHGGRSRPFPARPASR